MLALEESNLWVGHVLWFEYDLEGVYFSSHGRKRFENPVRHGYGNLNCNGIVPTLMCDWLANFSFPLVF